MFDGEMPEADALKMISPHGTSTPSWRTAAAPRQKSDWRPLRADRGVEDFRQAFAAALQPQPRQIDLYQFGVEAASGGYDDFGLRGTDLLLIRIRIGEIEHA